MMELCLLIPCYNEEKRLKIKEFHAFIVENPDIHFYFIDDGSKDNTKGIITEHFLKFPNCYLFSCQTNLGKGNAIRSAVNNISAIKYEYYGFIDADLEIPLMQVLKLRAAIQTSSENLLAITTRNIQKNFTLLKYRSIISAATLKVANYILNFSPALKDTQCGCKLFKKEIMDHCFEEPFISGWLFDIEIFMRVKETYGEFRSRIVEIPLENLNKPNGSSTIKFTHHLRVLKEFRMIYLRYN